MRKHVAAVLVGCGLVGLGGGAFADHNEPAKANKLLAKLVTAYNQCLAPNDDGVVLPGCSPTSRADAVCGYDPANNGATGQIKLIAVNDNGTPALKVIVKVKGLAAGCEGETLAVKIETRESGHSCQLANPLGCTILDHFPPPVVACVVTGGQCSINTTLTGFWTAGNETGIEIRGLGLLRTSAVNGPLLPLASYTFKAGLLLP